MFRGGQRCVFATAEVCRNARDLCRITRRQGNLQVSLASPAINVHANDVCRGTRIGNREIPGARSTRESGNVREVGGDRIV